MAAISSPLLETSIAGATGVLISITASEDIQLDEVDIASQMIHEEAHPDANIIWGANFDPTLEDEMRITIIATGFDRVKAAEAIEQAAAAKTKPVEPVVEPVVEVAPQVNAEPVAAEPEFIPYTPVQRTAPEVKVAPETKTVTDAFDDYDDVIKFITRKR